MSWILLFFPTLFSQSDGCFSLCLFTQATAQKPPHQSTNHHISLEIWLVGFWVDWATNHKKPYGWFWVDFWLISQ
jgi:hypothetical protein